MSTQGRDRARIRARLERLVGLRFGIARRAVDMRIIHVGEMVRVDGGAVGRWALHLQCPWRVVGTAGIVTGSDDGFTEQDRRLARWLRGSSPSDRPRIRAIAIGEAGAFSLDAGAHGRLEALPCGSGVREDWRIIAPDDLASHLVVRGGSVLREGGRLAGAARKVPSSNLDGLSRLLDPQFLRRLRALP